MARALRQPDFLASILIAVLLPLVLPSTALATEVLVFIIATLGCTLLIGYVGLLSFGQAIFFGFGAYAAGLSLLHLGCGTLAALGLTLLGSIAIGLFVGILATQKRGIYLVMLTFALSEMFYFVAYALAGVTGGDNGLINIPRPDLALFGHTLFSLATLQHFYLFAAVVFVLIYLFLSLLVASPFGSTLVAIRENEDRTMALGYHARLFKIAAFVVSAAITGLAGGLYTLFLNFAPLSNIDVGMSERILIMSILGGTKSLFGGVLGAVFFVVAGNFLSAIWPRWLLIIGLLLILVASYLHGGLLSGLEWLLERTGLGRFAIAARGDAAR
ncbi:MAG: branched-chain amino acid ABC transporter permease [Acetobacteraceae bacterium]